MGFRLGSTGVTIIFGLCKLRPEYTLKCTSVLRTPYIVHEFDYTLDNIFDEMKSSLPEPDSSIRLYYAFTYSNAASVSQVASTIERMWSVGLDEVLSTSQYFPVYTHTNVVPSVSGEGLGIYSLPTHSTYKVKI